MKKSFGCIYDEVTQKIKLKNTNEETDEEMKILTR